MEPASKVSVPFTVVMRMRSRVPERVLEPAKYVVSAAFEWQKTPFPTKVLVETNSNLADPCLTVDAVIVAFNGSIAIPDV